MSKEYIGMGLIGCGVVANGIYLPHTNTQYHGCNIELVAVCDAVEEKAIRAKSQYGARRRYTDYRDLLADPKVDAVVIATNIATHAEIALSAARAGKHILVQKPIANTMEEADRILTEAERNGIKLLAEPAHMLNPLCVRAREAIASGALGKVCMIQGLSAHSGADDRPWLFQKEGGGSVMMDMGVHAITWLVSLAGPVHRVTAFTKTSVPTRTINGQQVKVDIDDNIVLLLDFRDGGLGTVTANYTTVANQAPAYNVYGTAGTIHINAPQAPFMMMSQRASYLDQTGWLIPTTFRGHREQIVSAPFAYDSHTTHPHLSIGHFYDCLIEDKDPVPSGTLARHVLEIMTGAAESQRTGYAQAIQSSFEPLPLS